MPQLKPLTGRWAQPLVHAPVGSHVPEGFGSLSNYLRPMVDQTVRPLAAGMAADRSKADYAAIDRPSFLIVRQTLLPDGMSSPCRRWLLYGRLTISRADEEQTASNPCAVEHVDDACIAVSGCDICCAQQADPDAVDRYSASLVQRNLYQADPVVAFVPHVPGPFEDLIREIWSRDSLATPARVLAGRWDDASLVEVLPVSQPGDVDQLVTHFGQQEVIIAEDCSQFEALQSHARAAGQTSLTCMTAICVAGEFGLDLGWLSPVFRVPSSLSFEILRSEISPDLTVAETCDSVDRLRDAIHASCRAGVPSFGIWDARKHLGHVVQPVDHDPLAGQYEEAPATWRRCVPILAYHLLLRPSLHRLLQAASLSTSPIGLASDLREFAGLCENTTTPDDARLGVLFCPTTTSAILGILQCGHKGYRLPAQSMGIRPPVPTGLVQVPI